MFAHKHIICLWKCGQPQQVDNRWHRFVSKSDASKVDGLSSFFHWTCHLGGMYSTYHTQWLGLREHLPLKHPETAEKLLWIFPNSFGAAAPAHQQFVSGLMKVHHNFLQWTQWTHDQLCFPWYFSLISWRKIEKAGHHGNLRLTPSVSQEMVCLYGDDPSHGKIPILRGGACACSFFFAYLSRIINLPTKSTRPRDPTYKFIGWPLRLTPMIIHRKRDKPITHQKWPV